MPVKTQRRERARARRDHLGARHADDLPRAAVVRARHDGLAREDEPRPRGRDPADGDPRDPERLRRPAARLADDHARRRPRARSDPRLDPAPLRGGRSSASACCSRSSRCSAASCRRTSRRSGRSCRSSSGRTRRACRRRTARSRGATRFAALVGPALAGASSPSSARRTCCTSMPRRTSSLSLLVLVFVPRRKPVGCCRQARRAGGAALPPRRQAARADGGDRRRLRILAGGHVGRAACVRVRRVRRELVVSPASSTRRSAPGRSSEAWSPSSSVRRLPPLRLAGARRSSPSRSRSGCFRSCRPGRSSSSRSSLATFFTPLINGPRFAVLTSRTPRDLRAKVMTAVISVEHARRPARFPRRRPGARALGRRAALHRGRPRNHVHARSSSPRSRGGTATASP